MAYFSKIYSSDLPHRAKAVYMYLKDRSNTDGQCYPAIGTIAKELNLSRRTVERAIQDLVKAGLIKKDRGGVKTEEKAVFIYADRQQLEDTPPRDQFVFLVAYGIWQYDI